MEIVDMIGLGVVAVPYLAAVAVVAVFLYCRYRGI